MYRNHSTDRRGFTLVELLVVITIIGILVSLTTAAAIGVRRAAIRSNIRSTMAQLEMALELYKSQHGEYPPNLADEGATMRHARKRWHRANLNYNGILTAAGIRDPDNRMQSECNALSALFWLNGCIEFERDSNGDIVTDGNGNPSVRIVGFSSNVADPLNIGRDTNGKLTESRLQPLLDVGASDTEFGDFDGRYVGLVSVSDKDGNTLVVPTLVARGAPIAYFCASAADDGYGAYQAGAPDDDGVVVAEKEIYATNFTDFSIAVPYAKDGTATAPVWYNPKTFQLIHPGLDNTFGDEELRRAKFAFASTGDQDRGSTKSSDLDNIVNFSESATLDGAIK